MRSRHFLICLILLVSTYFLLKMVTLPASELDDTSKVRFVALIFTNALLFVSVLALGNTSSSFKSVALVCAASGGVAVSLSVSEAIVRGIEAVPSYNYKKRDSSY